MLGRCRAGAVHMYMHCIRGAAERRRRGCTLGHVRTRWPVVVERCAVDASVSTSAGSSSCSVCFLAFTRMYVGSTLASTCHSTHSHSIARRWAPPWRQHARQMQGRGRAVCVHGMARQSAARKLICLYPRRHGRNVGSVRGQLRTHAQVLCRSACGRACAQNP
eukprot:scaffold72082_cov36-Phaeocystis_antarctica.AAC.1